MIVISVLMCFVLCASLVFAGEDVARSGDDSKWRFKPTLSVGYAFSNHTHIKFDSDIGLAGVRNIDLKIPGFSGVYLAAELPFALTDRLKLTLGGRLAFPGSNREATEAYNDFVANRDYDSNDRYWVTADLLLSYAFIKNVSCLKDLSAIIGFRWDYQTMSFDNPHSTFGILTSPLDKVSFRMYTYTPVFGLTSTFKKGRSLRRAPPAKYRSSIILCQNFEVSPGMLADRTFIRDILPFKDITTISAVPLHR